MGAQTQIHGKELLRISVQGQLKNLIVLRGKCSTKLFGAHPLVESFNKEHGMGLTVISHPVADVALNVGETWRSLPAFAVDASIAYEKPGTRLGKEIVFSAEGEPRVVLATGKYEGRCDIALVALGLKSADIAYTIGSQTRTLEEIWTKDGIDSLLAIDVKKVITIQLLVNDDRLMAVPDFPCQNGWYMPHAETGVPHGRKVDGSSDARYLYRLNDSSYVGLLVRVGIYVCGDGQSVIAYYGASIRFGVVAEVPEGDAAKIEALLKPAL